MSRLVRALRLLPALAGLAGLAGLAAPAGAAPIEAYTARAPLVLRSDEGLQRLELPLAVLQASRSPGLADLRLFDADGTPVPWAWLPEPSPSSESREASVPRFPWPPGAQAGADDGIRVDVDGRGAVVRVRPAGRNTTDGRATHGPEVAAAAWLLDLGALKAGDDGERLAALTLDWRSPPAGWAGSVRVEASDDARRFAPVTQGTLLALPGSGGPAPAVRSVPWPDGAPALPRYLRLAFDHGIELTGSEVRLVRAGHGRSLQSLPVRFEHAPAEGREPPQWTADLGARLALKSLRIELPQPNTVLRFRLDRRDATDAPWQPVRDVSVWRLVRDGRDARTDEVAIDAPAGRYWRLLPDARTMVPGRAPLDATVSWRAPELVFVARSGVRLAVGRERDAPAGLPIGSLVPDEPPARAAERMPRASVGMLTAHAATAPGLLERLIGRGPEERRERALWAVLAAVVAGLGLLAWRLGRDLSRGPHG